LTEEEHKRMQLIRKGVGEAARAGSLPAFTDLVRSSYVWYEWCAIIGEAQAERELEAFVEVELKRRWIR